MKSSPVLVTGAAGFIGSSLCRQLLEKNVVVGIDNYYPNYSIQFKQDRIQALKKHSNFYFYKEDIRKTNALKKILNKYQVDAIFHLGALTGVRTSLSQTAIYQDINVRGTKSIFELAVNIGVKKFIFASSSSVYGNSKQIPFVEDQPLNPCSPYAKSKKDAEDILHKLVQIHQIKTIILRLFSVYGPEGRPDMAPYLFTERALLGKVITRYGDGTQTRDFTYIDDVVDAFMRTLNLHTVFNIFNIGNTSPISLNQLINLIEKYTHKKVLIKEKPQNKAESLITHADISKANMILHWVPKINFSQGLLKFVNWYKRHRLSIESK